MRKLFVRMKKFWAVLFLLSVNSICFAQIVNPCDGSDQDDDCPVPLDTWVYVLVIIALVYTGYTLHKKQKSLSA
ncbi:hypothetical protein [Mucilaginibacter sp.]|uniref:hypothetical protein n=1 Tax=Mucilaginibacter sp. TaxID=1882438 RepID=UPI0032647621